MPPAVRCASDLVDSLGRKNNPEWKTVAFDEKGDMISGSSVPPGDKAWNLMTAATKNGPRPGARPRGEVANVGFPYFGGEGSEHFNKSIWKIFCCTNCRPNATRSWPTTLPPWSPPCMT
ncbi:hypothetical protein MJ579_17635 [Klebsiella pneumoniae]|nr:hypothetical protein MJ579_17635 [Klebsiella pneumoniae]